MRNEAHMNYLRRKTADEAELWAADRIEELEGANILNSNALRLQKKKSVMPSSPTMRGCWMR